AGVQRLVYLGGIRPQGPLSEHLLSRLEVGEMLRSGSVSTVELRASMIIGHGSLSWLIVRDLAARLPFMILPSWLKSRTQPIAIVDVVRALLDALELRLEGSDHFDIPGPETLTARDIMFRIAKTMGLPQPVVVEVPVLTPWLSSHWVRFVTRAEWAVAREIVVGLTDDMLAADNRFWKLTHHEDLLPFDDAVREALRAEGQDAPIPGFWGSVEAAMARRARPRARQ
ncbi:MAG: NAD-dependent epimerase, partial [Actinomycetota bacterium]